MYTVPIRNMVCLRCELTVRQLAEATGVPVVEVGRGYATFAREPPPPALTRFAEALAAVGLPIIRGREAELAERLELTLRALASELPLASDFELNAALAERLDEPVDWAARAFREDRGVTAQARFTTLIMEEAARLLREGELQVTEVGALLGYRHLSGFSRAFKRATGISPVRYRDREVAGRAGGP